MKQPLGQRQVVAHDEQSATTRQGQRAHTVTRHPPPAVRTPIVANLGVDAALLQRLRTQPAETAAMTRRLQQSYGNQYTQRVAALIQRDLDRERAGQAEVMQRMPALTELIQRQDHPQVAASTTERLSEAARRLRDATFMRTLQDQLTTYYGRTMATSNDAVAEAIWAGPLGLAGIEADALSDRRERQQFTALRSSLRAWVQRALTSFFRTTAPFTFLGFTTGKSSGVHRTVARALELVERSALRIAGVAGVAQLPDHPRFFGFRFQPEEGDLLKKRQISYHGSGRAIDARAQTNPMFSGAVEQVVSVLGTEELYDLAISRPALAGVASQIRPLMDRRTALVAQLAQLPPADPGRAALEQELATVEQSLTAINQSPQVTSLRHQATEVHRRTEAAEAAFQQVWRELTHGSGRAQDVDLNALRARVTAALAADQQLLTQIETELGQADAAIAQMTGRDQRAARRQAQAQREQTRRERQQPTAQRVRRLEQLLALLAAPEQLTAQGAAANRVRAATGARDQVLRQAADVARHGITDFPVWLVQAFAEQGWSWGASWHEPKDAMHFDYMGPVEMVTTP